MLIKEVNFSNNNEFSKHKGTEVIPVFMQYGNLCYEIATNEKHVDNAWPIFQKIFYYKFYNEYKNNLDYFFEKRLFTGGNSNGIIIFSKFATTFHNKKNAKREIAIKFGKRAYVYNFQIKYRNLIILKILIKNTNLQDFRLFVTTTENIKEKEFNNEYNLIKDQFNTKNKQVRRKKGKSYQIKKGNFVIGHINSMILSEEEKLYKYVKDEYKKKNLLGDIILNEEQEKTLNSYMCSQLKIFNNDPINYKAEQERLFALGLVRYAMRNYNTKGKGEFWRYFYDDYDISVAGNNQKYIHSIFETVMKKYEMVYSDDTTQKIDNITMHSFVADHSANQLFDYLFDFWRLDLGRNSDNLNITKNGESDFDTLIKAMKNGTKDVMTHTSLLLNFGKTIPAFKNRVKRIIKLMNESFWNDTTINETGNRINHLLNCWINNPNGAFQKEKNYVARQRTKEKSEILFHTPIFNINYEQEILKIILPHQRLIECTKEDKPKWIIKCSSNDFEEKVIPTNEHYKHDKIGCYVEKMYYEIPLRLLLNGFEFLLINGDKELKKYKIQSSKIRFFDENGKYIDHKNTIIPASNVTVYSDSDKYPLVLGKTTQSIKSNELVMKCFNLVKGQVITLEDNTGIQVGQSFEKGLNEAYPVNGATLLSGDNVYKIYGELPNLLFEANPNELNGISLIINGKQNKIIDKSINDFKISKGLNKSGYQIKLSDYIFSEGLYNIVLSYPKMHKKIEIGNFAYIKEFDYEFIDSPYVFEDYGKIQFKNTIKIIQNDKEGKWFKNLTTSTFEFNFGERNTQSDNYCELVKDKELVLNCEIGSKQYPIHFEIPALYWKFSTDDDWNTRKPANIPLKDFKNKIKKLYVNGPFNFSKSIIFTEYDADISEVESEIKFSTGKNNYFEIEKIYNWYKSDRSKVYRKIFITLDDKKIELLNVICKSVLNDVNIFGDFDNKILIGNLNIEGNEDYTVSICCDGNVICEDEQVIDKQFIVESELLTGNYEIKVYELVESDEDDGFDVGVESFPLNEEPIVKRLINLNDLEGKQINLIGYQDINKKYTPLIFSRKYVITRLKKTTYTDFLKKETDSEIYGIWNENIDCANEIEMNKYTMYFGKLGFYKHDDSIRILTDVIIIYPDKMNPESILILSKDENNDYCSLFINNNEGMINSGLQYSKMSKDDKRKWDCFFDDLNYYLTEIEEE